MFDIMQNVFYLFFGNAVSSDLGSCPRFEMCHNFHPYQVEIVVTEAVFFPTILSLHFIKDFAVASFYVHHCIVRNCVRS